MEGQGPWPLKFASTWAKYIQETLQPYCHCTFMRFRPTGSMQPYSIQHLWSVLCMMHGQAEFTAQVSAFVDVRQVMLVGNVNRLW